MALRDCITIDELAPSPRLEALWSAIVIEDGLRDQLVHHALLALTLRRMLPFTATAVHGLLLLYGPPGTGKTSLARGLSAGLAHTTGDQVRLVEVSPNGVMSSNHGRSQQQVHTLLCELVPERAADGRPTVMVVDEVETLAVARSQAGLSANPVDVHRATDAVLTSLDHLAIHHPHIVSVVTTNFTRGLDEAFVSRADLAVEVALPDAPAIERILRRTLADYATVFPDLSDVAADPALGDVAELLVGADGRTARKFVAVAAASTLKTARDPGRIRIETLLAAAVNPAASRGPIETTTPRP